jgi:hypothetical protein
MTKDDDPVGTVVGVATVLLLFVSFAGVFYMGYCVGSIETKENMRPLMISHCVEKPDLCKEEYDHNKQWGKLKEYQRPEIGENK